jgi:hypothetical protein
LGKKWSSNPLYMKVAPMVSTVPAANMRSNVISCSTKADSAVVKITEMAVPDADHGDHQSTTGTTGPGDGSEAKKTNQLET